MTTTQQTTYLFSESGQEALRAFIDRDTLFAFDLDGTLAPIVPDPGGIVIPPEIRAGLVRLDRLVPVAIITGRSRTDALSHLGFTPRFLVGNHGAEGLPGYETTEQEFGRLCRTWEEQLSTLLPYEERNGIVLENKGASLALHYRNTPDRIGARQRILAAVQRLTPPPRQISGKLVKNLVAHDAPHKGEALLGIMTNLRVNRALFTGDDVTDEDVFRLGDERIFSIRVGKDSGSAARYHLCDQVEIVALIDVILATLND